MIFLACLIINLNWISLKIITHKFHYTFDRPTLTININQERNKLFPFINTFHPFTLIRTCGSEMIIDEFVLGIKTINLENQMNIIDYKTDIKFESIYLKDYHIYLYKNHAWYPDQGIGLAYKFDNENYSLVHLLYKNKTIEKKNVWITF